MQPERLSGFYKKEIMRIAAVMAAFLFLENKSDKSQGLGQSPKVLTGNRQCSLIREGHRRKALKTTPDIKTESGRKHLVLLSLMYATGARVQEIADLIVSDIMYNGNSLVKLTGKGNKSRFVPLEPPVVKLLIQYLEDFSLIDPSRRMDFLFKNHSQKNSLDKV